MNQDQREEVKSYAKSLRWGPKDFYWEHTLQVRDFALMIQKKVGGDKDVVEAAALLHDIGKAKLLAPEPEKISANLANTFLEKVGFSRDKIDKVTECIKYENSESIEAKILRSADSMSLIMNKSGGREWYFRTILKNSKRRIINEIEKSYSEIEFDFARRFIEENYNELLEKYK